MHKDGRGRSESTLVTVSLPPLPGRGASRPGGAHRIRPPTPPPRPESSLVAPPPPTSSPSSGPGRGVVSDPPPLLHLPPSLSALDSPITLTSPRTVSARIQNLYVDTPFSGPGSVPGGPGAPPTHTRPCASLPSAVKRSSRTVIKTQSVSPCLPTNSTVITQPTLSPVSPLSTCPKTDQSEKPSPVTGGGISGSPLGSSPGTESIICVRCGRCRCAACGTPKSLPAVWLCDNCCLCSAESVLDTVSCMCCVKAAFYHCGERLDQDSDKEDSWVDSPCSCSQNKWWLRWGCLALMSLPLPCLLCYPLLRGLTKGAEQCYQSATSQGCRCPENTDSPTPSSLSSPTDSQKRLLG